MDASLLTGVLDTVREAVADVEAPADPFEAKALADTALVLRSDLLDLVCRIHDHHQDVRRQWVDHDRELAKLDPAGTPPPPPPPPPPPAEASGPGGKGDGGGTGYPPPPPPGGGS